MPVSDWESVCVFLGLSYRCVCVTVGQGLTTPVSRRWSKKTQAQATRSKPQQFLYGRKVPWWVSVCLVPAVLWGSCVGCYKITTVFSHAQTVVLCVSCSTVLAQPTGGRARLTEGKQRPHHTHITHYTHTLTHYTHSQGAVSDGSHIKLTVK